MNLMNYNGYRASIEYDDESKSFHGRLLDIDSVITFEGKSVEKLQQAMASEVNDYLAFCKEKGIEPLKSFSGRFVVRVDPAVHKALVDAARQYGISLNQIVADACQAYLINTAGLDSLNEEPALNRMRGQFVDVVVPPGRPVVNPKTWTGR